MQSLEERLSISYVSAVVARAGFAFDLIQQDYGVDLGIRRIDRFRGNLVDMGVAVDCQLKATINWHENAESILYDMEVESYNKLIHRSRNSASPCILVLYCLPKNEVQWLAIDDQQLSLRKCCYWIFLNGPVSENKESCRVSIPKANWFCPEGVTKLVERALEGNPL
jgi:hypothetical protein